MRKCLYRPTAEELLDLSTTLLEGVRLFSINIQCTNRTFNAIDLEDLLDLYNWLEDIVSITIINHSCDPNRDVTTRYQRIDTTEHFESQYSSESTPVDYFPDYK